MQRLLVDRKVAKTIRITRNKLKQIEELKETKMYSLKEDDLEIVDSLLQYYGPIRYYGYFLED